jgi:integrase/recombinase XerD
LGYQALWASFARRCARLGIRTAWVTPHALRHTHATALFANSFKDLLTESGKLLGMGPDWLTPLDVEVRRIGDRQPAAHRTLAGASIRIALCDGGLRRPEGRRSGR